MALASAASTSLCSVSEWIAVHVVPSPEFAGFGLREGGLPLIILETFPTRIRTCPGREAFLSGCGPRIPQEKAAIMRQPSPLRVRDPVVEEVLEVRQVPPRGEREHEEEHGEGHEDGAHDGIERLQRCAPPPVTLPVKEAAGLRTANDAPPANRRPRLCRGISPSLSIIRGIAIYFFPFIIFFARSSSWEWSSAIVPLLSSTKSAASSYRL